MNRMLHETLAIVGWSFLGATAIGVVGALLFRWPITVTYMLSVLTIGPALAVLRGRDRSRDPLELGERAGVELVAILILLGIGWLAGHYLGV
ncbi:hypothetical protein [Symbiobacterium thermophilum]|jgi:hypothetical protein|uniref:Uncharacterized protein n=1 Tax=Symbiobacterium thermophilum TaxID=2734 RepID=A0A953LK20_SYMTR|nr:hypothetical protein [Symbiobacterium thermophilum]MBY6276517.1 hypothetical protein [Symbiobacterium thermophilum]